jgi:diguanylate cyclase (GGDEF)-like protein
MLWAVATSAVILVALTGLLTSSADTTGLRDSASRLLPPSSALARTQLSAASFNELLVATLQAADVDREIDFDEMSRLTLARDRAWADYRRAAANLPGEKALRAEIETNRELAGPAAVTLITSPAVSTEVMAVFVAQIGAETQSLMRLQELYQDRINASVIRTDRDLSAGHTAVLIVTGTAVLLLIVVFGLRYRAVRRRERVQADDDRRNDLESGLQRALEMARTEDDCYQLVRRAVQGCSSTLPSELLVADSSGAHFHQVMTTVTDTGPGCAVMAPNECPATNRGQTQRWSTSTAIDACPNLQDRDGAACSAVCVPVSIAGKSIGVVHATGPDHHPPAASITADLEVIVRKAGDRIGILRAFSRTELQAQTDPLTGLLNRRSLETAVGDLEKEAHSYAVAYGDLDHFKLLNDVHGHEAGDRALRLFARVLRDSIRPNDIAARYGGEEFVVALPDCSAPDAYAVIDRVRTRLADAQRGGVVPPFTVSFGLAPAMVDLRFGEIVEHADAALLRAKTEGRDRVVLASGDQSNPDPETRPATVTAEALTSK